MQDMGGAPYKKALPNHPNSKNEIVQKKLCLVKLSLWCWGETFIAKKLKLTKQRFFAKISFLEFGWFGRFGSAFLYGAPPMSCIQCYAYSFLTGLQLRSRQRQHPSAVPRNLTPHLPRSPPRQWKELPGQGRSKRVAKGDIFILLNR